MRPLQPWPWMALLLIAGCRTPTTAAHLTRENREWMVRQQCRYIRPDMALSDANELFGWGAKFDQGDWYWTDSRRFIVHTGDAYRIVECYDFYRFVHYHKLVEKPGVFMEHIPTRDADGNPINGAQE